MNSLKKVFLTLVSIFSISTLVRGTPNASSPYGGEVHVEYPPYDGWYNNYAHPDWGAADTQLIRKLAPAYEDGVFMPAGATRPNPHLISDAIMNGTTGFPSYRNRTAFLVFFGQQVVEEILDAQRPGCPPEYFNIPVPRGHKLYDTQGRGDRELPLLRSRYDFNTGQSPNNPRQQLNEITPFLDGGLVYGPNKAWADALRSYSDGLLAATNDSNPSEGYYPAYNDIRLPLANPPPPRDHILKPIRRFYKLGNPRGNENPFLLTFGILWFRYHNFKARQIKHVHPDWDDEQIFNEARKWTIAIHQKIVVYDWLPIWLNESLPDYTGYDPQVHPGIAHVFQSAAMRFGHTLVPPGVFRRNARCEFRNTTRATFFEGHAGVRTCNSYWNPQESIMESDIDEFLMGMASQITEREDNIITPDLRGKVFGPLEFSRRDLMAINMQRGRDHGLPDYNTARRGYGLPPITSWADINPFLNSTDPSIFRRMESVYKGKLDDVDIWAGGLLETTPDGPGPLFRAIIRDQFVRIRDADRFWYENRLNGLFTENEIAEIQNITIYDVVISTTGIGPNDIQKNPFIWLDGDVCPQEQQISEKILSECTPVQPFDYFNESQVSFALSFVGVGVFLIAIVTFLYIFAHVREAKITKEKNEILREKTKKYNEKSKEKTTPCIEWVGPKEGNRSVSILLDPINKDIIVKSLSGAKLRSIDISITQNLGSNNVSLIVSADKRMRMINIRVPKEVDLVLIFDGMAERDSFVGLFQDFLKDIEVGRTIDTMNEKMIRELANTKQKRQKLLEKFFRTTIAHAFEHDQSSDLHLDKMDKSDAREVISCELTKDEFADALSLTPTSLFVENMFFLADKDGNGYISFREFLDVIIIFAKGDSRAKAEMLFNMYDLSGDGELSRAEFKTMIRSLMELSNASVDEDTLETLIEKMYQDAGFKHLESISLANFNALLKDFENDLNYAQLDLAATGVDIPKKSKDNSKIPATMRAKSFHQAYDKKPVQKRPLTAMHSGAVQVDTVERTKPKGAIASKFTAVIRYMENYKLHIFWGVLYTLLTFGIFAERAYYYGTEREHIGLRRITGYGVSMTRGAASGMMFTFSTLLVTMCRNLITFLRETFVHRYIPFDAAIPFHKYVSLLALFYTAIHIGGHGFNFYHISTQTANDLTCLFRDYFHATDELPKLHYWLWNTLTGFAGVLVLLLMIVMYVFATEYSRRKLYKVFWFTHSLYPLFFILMILHAAGRLVQAPFIHYFLLGPVILFALDRLVSVSRKRVEISVVKAELLPSEVTNIVFTRPANFAYKSGQWVRIACLALGKDEYHPFTLSSAPHEEHLSLHIRAIGPWTTNLRRTYDPTILRKHALPKIYLDGPYGEGHQDWFRYEVAVLIGGGIGVTPFASILKDIAHRSQSDQKIVCKKVYFIWVTRTQKQFEWMTDIIRQVEETDISELVSIHIFITQFKEKFDLRTTMLYICERYFQKISDRSLFTGLKSVTHFGRPHFDKFFNTLLSVHADVNVFGAFSCGPPPMTKGVEEACSKINKYTTNALFVHHSENF